MQGCGIALNGEARPFAKRVEGDVDIVGSVAAFVAASGPDEMLQRFQTEGTVRRLDEQPVDVEVIGAAELGAMQFGAANKEVDEVAAMREPGAFYVVEEAVHESSLVDTYLLWKPAREENIATACAGDVIEA